MLLKYFYMDIILNSVSMFHSKKSKEVPLHKFSHLSVPVT